MLGGKQMNTYFIADTHFDHKNILQFENRPYETNDEMRQDMINKWNNKVQDEDIVYFMGDFSLGNHNDAIEILKQLKGRIRFIAGNHDNSKFLKTIKCEELVEAVYEFGTKIKHNKHVLWLSHFPMEIGERPFKWSIHGHIHAEESTYLNQINVGVDSPHFKHLPFGEPIHIDEIFKVMESRMDAIQEVFEKSRELMNGYFKIDEPIMVREGFYMVAVYIPSEKDNSNNAIVFSGNPRFPDSFKELGGDGIYNFYATYFDYPHRYSDDFSPEEMVTFDSIEKYSRGELFINSGIVEFVSAEHTNTIYPDAIYGCKFTGKGITKIEDERIIKQLEDIRRVWRV